ncbi:O-antigen polysaccharide polymerase Wzy [Ruminococcus sp. AF18-22]|nr:O-antigen polysaccharide polymerase Wzy [Ruminococcus sp. AF18-22]
MRKKLKVLFILIKNSKKNILKCIRYTCFILGVISFIIFKYWGEYNSGIFAILFFVANNLLYCLENTKDRIILLILHVTIFVFLISRPFIECISDSQWYIEYVDKYGLQSFEFAINSIVVSLVAFFGGAILYEIKNIGTSFSVKKVINNQKREKYRNIFIKNLQKVALIIFYISFFATMILEFEKLWFMRGKEYVEYYTSFVSQAPYIIYVISTFMRYSLCIFLATMPRKEKCLLPLGAYLLSAVPNLIIGMRNPIMQNGIFVFVYYFIRHSKEEKWFGKIEKVGIVVGLPLILIFMSVYASLRVHASNISKNFFFLLGSFFYGQGVTFDVLNIGYTCIDQLPVREFRNYTFGGIIDYFLHGAIAQKIFGAQALNNVNSIENALYSNNFSHNMSYIAKGEDYLKGKGWGSSYLLETYVDFGYIGIVIYSFLLAIILLFIVKLIRRNTITGTISLLIITQVFFIPRAEATGFLNFLFQAQFWAAIIICYLGAGLCCKKYEFVKKEHNNV